MGTCRITVYRTAYGSPALVIGNDSTGYRLAGPKVGGGVATADFVVDIDDLIKEARTLKGDHPDETERDLARVTAERDEARLRATELGARVAAISKDLGDAWIERDALRAEVEAMRGVVDAAFQVHDAMPDYEDWERLGNALDALRARKVAP